MSHDMLSKIFKMYNGIQYLDQSNVYPKNLIDLILAEIIQSYVSWFSLRIFLKLCGIMGHNT